MTSIGEERKLNFKHVVWIVLIFVPLLLLLLSAEEGYGAILTRFMTWRSEYTLTEQSSKLFYFTIILLSIVAYRNSARRIEVLLALSYLLIGLVMYMSESNMIKGGAQPVYGVPLVLLVTYCLVKSERWLGLFCLFLGFASIACGVLSDFVQESETIAALIPGFIKNFLGTIGEESFDFVGAGIVCLSALLSLSDYLVEFVRENKTALPYILLFAILLTFGNGFLHFQYDKTTVFRLSAQVSTLAGFYGLAWLNGQRALFSLITEDNFVIFLFVFFVLMPSISGTTGLVVALVMWFPIISLGGFYLWKRHPINTAVTEASASTGA